jgi:hypothetical protein
MKRGFKMSSDDKGVVRKLFDGELGNFFFCAEANGEYSLYKRIVERFGEGPAIESIPGYIVNDDNTYLNSPKVTFDKGEFTELRLSTFEAPVFCIGAKVLCMKPTTNGEFTKKFYPATIVSGPIECVRKQARTGIFSGGVNEKRKRHKYEVRFDGKDKNVYSVFEEFVVPTKEHWGKEKLKYEATPDDTETSSSSESESESSEDEEKDKKQKKEKLKSKKRRASRKKAKHRHRHNKRSSNVLFEGTGPSIVVIPVIVPYNAYFGHFQPPLQYQFPFFR